MCDCDLFGNCEHGAWVGRSTRQAFWYSVLAVPQTAAPARSACVCFTNQFTNIYVLTCSGCCCTYAADGPELTIDACTAIRAKAEQLVDVAPRRGELQLVELRPRGCRADEPRN